MIGKSPNQAGQARTSGLHGENIHTGNIHVHVTTEDSTVNFANNDCGYNDNSRIIERLRTTKIR